MKPDESRELACARKLLSEFESEMTSPGAEAKLSEALSLLAETVEERGAQGELASNIVGVYAAKTVAAVDATLAKPGEVSTAELRHWQELLTEFGRCGFEASPVSGALSKVSKRLATRHVAKLTQFEKEVLLKKLEDDLEK